jgi:GNAT superfamily N-acetyltransferase
MTATLIWKHEPAPVWDADKVRVLECAPPGVFASLRALPAGAPLAGSWGCVVRDGAPIAYGWMDITWGDAEVLLAVDDSARHQGVGTFVLDRLEEEARAAGLRYLYNVVPPEHTHPEGLTSWLLRRSFVRAGEGGLLRRQVR